MIRVSRVGLCGTDYHIFGGQHPFLEYPRVIGHEFSGYIDEVNGPTELKKGELVVVNPYLNCGKCRACGHGKPNCCERIQVLGVHKDGAMSEFVAVPCNAIYSAGTLTESQAAMVEFLAIGAHAARRAQVSPGQQVLVTGMGPIGIAVASFSRLRGAEVSVVDINRSRLEKARDLFHFNSALEVSSDLQAQLAAITQGHGFDVAFDVTGSATGIEAGFTQVAHGGTYALVSVVNTRISFSDPEFHKREMNLIGSRNATKEDFELVMTAIQSGQVPTDKLGTHECSLDEVPSALPEYARSPDTVIKAIARIS